MYKDDALTRYTRQAASQVMRLIHAQPQGARAAAVQEALDAIRPGLFQKVDRMAANLVKEGIAGTIAYEEAIRLALADVFVDSVKALGRAKETGRVDDAALDAQRMFYGEPDLRGLGGTGLSGAGKDAANFLLNTVRAAACSPEVKDLVLNAVGDRARAATSAGLSVAQGVSACSRLPGATPAGAPPPPPPPPAPPPPPPPKDNTMLYLGIGGAVLGLGVIAFFALRK